MEFESGYLTTVSLQERVNALLQAQLKDWELAAKNYKGLEKVRKRYLTMNGGVEIGIQFNPERIYSSAAKVDKKSISGRKCFLCIPHLPEQQLWISFREKYVILVNPFPIFPKHLTITHREHTAQSIEEHLHDMLMLAGELDRFVVFYNGPRCGASAPDHLHFQAGSKGFMPVEDDFERFPKSLVKKDVNCNAWTMDDYLRHCLVLEGDDVTKLCQWFYKVVNILKRLYPGNEEPMMNILASRVDDGWRVFIFPRKLHRPWQFFAEGDAQILLSPASVDMGGVLITPRELDYNKITPENIVDIFSQVAVDNAGFNQLCAEFAL